MWFSVRTLTEFLYKLSSLQHSNCIRTVTMPLPVMMVRVVLSHGVTLLPGRSRRARCCKPEPGYNTENRLLQFQTTEVLSHPSTLLPTLSGCLGDGDTQYTMSSSSLTNTVSKTHSHNNNIFFFYFSNPPGQLSGQLNLELYLIQNLDWFKAWRDYLD